MSIPPADVSKISRYLEQYYSAMETNDPQRYAAYYADEIRLTFGNEATIHGRHAVVDAFDDVLSRVSSLHHQLVNVWTQQDGIVVFESIGTWSLRNGQAVSVPACSVFTISDGLLTELRIYVDNAPVFAALDAERLSAG